MFSSIHRASVHAVVLAATLLAGCSNLDVPRADNYPATGQKKARAVHHWDVLADDVAARVAEKTAAWPEGGQPIHVTVADNSSFNQGFLKLLRVRLLNKGWHCPPGRRRWSWRFRRNWCSTRQGFQATCLFQRPGLCWAAA